MRYVRRIAAQVTSPKFFCRLISNPHGRFYELKCERGTLRGLFPGGELREVPPEVAIHYQSIISLDGPRRHISLAAAAKLARTGPPQTVTSKCKRQCTKSICGCMKAGVRCSKRCHGACSQRCENLEVNHSGDQGNIVSSEQSSEPHERYVQMSATLLLS